MHNKNGQDKAFYFKQFQINHDRCAMKVGTDGVLLGAWCPMHDANTILDIGTGSGLIALMLAQRTDESVIIDAVESDHESYVQCCDNFELSPWRNRLRVFHTRIQDFRPDNKYDLIVCNPPYFTTGQQSPNLRRGAARHSIGLTPQDLIISMKSLLNPSGKLALILPYVEGTSFIAEMAKHSFFCKTIVQVKVRKNLPTERVLLTFGRESMLRQRDTLILFESDGIRSHAYHALVNSFYL